MQLCCAYPSASVGAQANPIRLIYWEPSPLFPVLFLLSFLLLLPFFRLPNSLASYALLAHPPFWMNAALDHMPRFYTLVGEHVVTVLLVYAIRRSECILTRYSKRAGPTSGEMVASLVVLGLWSTGQRHALRMHHRYMQTAGIYLTL